MNRIKEWVVRHYNVILAYMLLRRKIYMLLRQGRRKHLKLGRARHFEGMFLLKKRGHFLKMKRALLCLLQNLGRARAPSAPVPTSMLEVNTPKILPKSRWTHNVLNCEACCHQSIARQVSIERSQRTEFENSDETKKRDFSSLGIICSKERQRQKHVYSLNF